MSGRREPLEAAAPAPGSARAPGMASAAPARTTSPTTMIAGLPKPVARRSRPARRACRTPWRCAGRLACWTIADRRRGGERAQRALPAALDAWRCPCRSPASGRCARGGGERRPVERGAAASRRAWPVTNITPWAWSRWVSGTPIDVAAARPAVMPLTTSTSMPAARRCSTSSPPRPKTNGSPPLRRTTRSPRRASAHHQLLDEGLRRAGAAAALADVDDARAAAARSAARRRRPGRRPAARSAGGSRAPPSRQQLRVAGTGADEVDQRRGCDAASRRRSGRLRRAGRRARRATMRRSSGRHEPQLVPHFSSACSAQHRLGRRAQSRAGRRRSRSR